jgi:hypothetical protein
LINRRNKKMKKWLLCFLVVIFIFGLSNVYAQKKSPPPPPYIIRASDCSFLTWYGMLCHDIDDGKLYKWDGANLVELASAGGTGDITDVWNCSTGDCSALVAGASDYLNAGSASYIIPFVVSTDCSAVTGEGRACWDSDNDILYIGDGVSAKAVSGTGDLKADGTVPLSANWDVGSFYIRAQTFVSDVATGTAPFTVSSTTEVTNLKAATATALAANGANCNAGYAPLGVDASGAVESCTQYQAYDVDLTTYAGITPSADIQTFLGAANLAAMKAQLSIDDLVTLSGVADGAVNLGTFTGATISDNITIKAALQEIETAFEGLPGGHTQNTDTGTTSATFTIESGGVKIKNSPAGTLTIRNNADAANAPLVASTITGTTITASVTFSGSLTGNADTATTATTATNVTVADTADTTTWVMLATDATGGVAPKTDTGLTYNASTGVLTATGFSGPLTGNVTGNASGTAATVTGAAQANITSLGTLTGLTVSGVIIPNAVATISLGSINAEWLNLYIGNSGVIYGQNDQSATLTSSASLWTANNFAITSAFTANGTATFGDGDTDTITFRSMLIGGNSREVQINAGARTAPTYPSATPTQDMYVKGNIETPATIYAASFNAGTGTDGQRGITLTSNTALTPTVDQIYFINDVLYFSQAGTQKTPMRLEDAQSASGIKTFSAGLYAGDASTNSGIRFYDGSSNYWNLIAPTGMSTNPTFKLPSAQASIGQYLRDTDGAGTMGWGTPTATAEGVAGSIQYTSTGVGGAFEGSTHFLYVVGATYADVTIGSEGTGRIGRLNLAYEGGANDYTVTIQPNSGMAGDVVITAPSYTTTLLGSGANTFTGLQGITAVNAAGGSADVLTLSGTLGIFDGSDTFRGIYLNYTDANHTGTGNTIALLDMAAITGDANSNLYAIRIGNLTGTTGAAGEVENAIKIGTGWDIDIELMDNTATITHSGTTSLTIASTAGIVVIEDIIFTGGALSSVTTIDMSGNLTVGPTTPDDVRPTLTIRGDADSDAGGDTTDAFTITLTPNANPVLATWGFTSTQSAGYTFDKAVTFSGGLTGNLTGNASGSAATLTGTLANVAASTSANLATCLSDEQGTGVAVFSDSPTFVDDITIAAAGVKLTGANGALTILGLGDGQDEDVKIDLNTTANTITISSPASSADTVSFSALKMVTTGTIMGAINVVADADSHTVTAPESYGTFFLAGGVGTWDLPEVTAAGQNLCIFSTTAAAITISPHANDGIMNGAARNANGHNIVSTAAIGAYVCLIADSGDGWTVLGKSGTWTDE